jgi:AcrR family transcriptional regulator
MLKESPRLDRNNGKATREEAGSRRLLDAARKLLSEHPPSSLSSRKVAGTAGVHHTLINYTHGSLIALFGEAFAEERARFNKALPKIAFQASDEIPLASYPGYWRAYVYVALDAQSTELQKILTHDHTAIQLATLLHTQSPRRPKDTNRVAAAAWWASQIGSLVFDAPLMQGLSVASRHQAAVRRQVAERLATLLRVYPDRLPPSAFAPAPTEQTEAETATGRKAIEEHLVHAAIDLLKERSGTGVSGRELAQRANVNYGLIHHYFGSKEAVFDAAFVRLHELYLRDVVTDDVHRLAAPFGMLAHEPFLRIWAYRELAGISMPSIDLKGMRLLLDNIARRRRIEARRGSRFIEAQANAYCAVALQLGWVLCRHDLTSIVELSEPAMLARLATITRWFTSGTW